ncbi:MAG TPA: helix-hairpin-helix domain-containing protein [Tepidisphaeraceae bacterium]|jgi:hypothetical protein|nr:helix-hairpin-helix domain-containing protein [Tepidisphaeraceae bacterium]
MNRSNITNLQDIPNIGPAMAEDFRRLGISAPSELVGVDPYVLYDKLCRVTGQKHDPCVIDTFIAAVRYMEGASAKPWWAYTAERKKTLAAAKKK